MNKPMDEYDYLITQKVLYIISEIRKFRGLDRAWADLHHEHSLELKEKIREIVKCSALSQIDGHAAE